MITTYFRIKTPYGHVAPGTPDPNPLETNEPLAARLFYPRAQAEAFLAEWDKDGRQFWQIEERPLRHEEPTPPQPAPICKTND